MRATERTRLRDLLRRALNAGVGDDALWHEIRRELDRAPRSGTQDAAPRKNAERPPSVPAKARGRTTTRKRQR